MYVKNVWLLKRPRRCENPRKKSPNLCRTQENLGIVFGAVEHWDEGQECLLASIELCKTVFPSAAGAFAAYLAVILAQQSKFSEANEYIVYGEAVLQDTPDLFSNFLCNKAKVLHLSHRTDEARDALLQARDIAQQLKTGQHSELAQLILKAEQFISTPTNSPIE